MTIPITSTFTIHTDVLHLRLEATVGAPRMQYKGQEMVVYYPATLDFKSVEGQRSAQFFVAESLRRYAKGILVPMMRQLAIDKGIPVKRITIKDVKTRWGSCSSLGNVNLSLWLLLLPRKCIHYVMLHELGHFAEMNHSPAFWQRVDTLLGEGRGAAKRLDKELTDTHRQLIASWRKIAEAESIPLVRH